jgi:uncharacterized protein (TIGR03000 family)
MRRKLALGLGGTACLVLLLCVPPASRGQPAKAAPAVIVVRLPDPEAEVLFDGVMTKQTGAVRRYVSPPLEPGKAFSYTVTAKWEPNNYTKITRSHKVTVRAGQESVADLRKQDPKQPDHVVVRYVPTPEDIVEAMCKLGKVTKDDVVFDLGCGDGRLVITAVGPKFKAKRGVGVDLDPERIKESKENAKKAKVQELVEFRVGNVLKVPDLKTATVVLLYMGDDINLQLRPILQKTLKPGSRIVSHRFKMGDWKPDKTEVIRGEDGDEYEIHLWTIK